MDYLTLCQRYVREAGIPGGGPSTVAGQTGELARAVGHVAEAWDAIQELRPNWAWQRASFALNTVADQAAYTLNELGIDTRFAYYERSQFKIYKQADGVATERPFGHIPYDRWWREHNIGTQTSQYPQAWTVRPEDDALILTPPPDAVYVLSGTYWKSQQHLADNDDVPEIGADYHVAIVWYALTYYADFEHDAFTRATAEARWMSWRDRIEQRYLPPVTIGAPAIGNAPPAYRNHGFDLD